MAGIDHTCLVFKNGKLLTEDEIGYYNYEKDEHINLLPFEYGRDGDIYQINDSDLCGRITWYKDEFDAVYQRCGLDEIGARLYKSTTRFSFWYIKQRLKWIFHVMEKVSYRKIVGVYRDGNTKLYIYHNHVDQSHASFYYDGVDSYVVLGGYGHWKNVYTHFMHRGYGEDFEEKMASEAYHWLWNEVLEEIAESLYLAGDIRGFEEQECVREELRKPYAKYDTYEREY